MTEMVERVAAALRALATDINCDVGEGTAFARAALRAIREPTAEMTTAGHELHWGHVMSSDDEERRNVDMIYRAMIDKALEE